LGGSAGLTGSTGAAATGGSGTALGGGCGGSGRSSGCGVGGRLRGGGSSSCGSGFGGFTRTLFRGFAVALFLLLTQAALLGELFFLLAQQLGLGAGFVLAAAQLVVVRLRCGGFVGVRFVALDERALLAHLDLDGAGLAAGIGLLDLAGRLAGQRDLLALAPRGTVRGTQVVEQPLLVGLGQRVIGGRLGDACRLELLEQCRGRAVELGGELGDGGHSHCVYPCLVRAVRLECEMLGRNCDGAIRW
jgi:hypothetical protein